MMGSERHGEALGQGEAAAVSGIIPQALVDIFGGIRQRRAAEAGCPPEAPQSHWRVCVSYLEVYNEQVN